MPLRPPRKVVKRTPPGGSGPSELVKAGRGNRLPTKVVDFIRRNRKVVTPQTLDEPARKSQRPPLEQTFPRGGGVSENPVKGQNPLGDLVEKYGEERVREGAEKLIADASVEWISTKEKAAEIGRGVTYVKDHAEELGGRKKGTRWYFPKGDA